MPSGTKPIHEMIREMLREMLWAMLWVCCLCPGGYAEARQPAEPRSAGAHVSEGRAPEETPNAKLLRAVAEERDALEHLRRDLLLEEKRLEKTREEIGERIAALKQIRAQVAKDMARYHSEREKEMNHLVKIYEAMSPEEAGPLVEQLAQDISVELLFRMKDKKAGRILEFVDEGRAVSITEDLARRKGKTRR